MLWDCNRDCWVSSLHGKTQFELCPLDPPSCRGKELRAKRACPSHCDRGASVPLQWLRRQQRLMKSTLNSVGGSVRQYRLTADPEVGREKGGDQRGQEQSSGWREGLRWLRSERELERRTGSGLQTLTRRVLVWSIHRSALMVTMADQQRKRSYCRGKWSKFRGGTLSFVFL